MGTQNGLFRYDGSRFKAFTKNDGLPGARIESLHEAADGTLWVGTAAGLARRTGERFQTVSLGAARGVTGREGIASDPQGRVYLATERGLLAGTSKGNDAQAGIVQFTPVGSVDDAVEAASVYLDPSGKLWFGCGLDLCILEDGGVRAVGREMGLPRERWDAILESPDGTLWVRSEKALYMRPRGSERFQYQTGVGKSEDANPTLGLDSVGRLLVPTDHGLARRTARGWETLTVNDSLGASDISAVFRDREGNIWLGLSRFGPGALAGLQRMAKLERSRRTEPFFGGGDGLVGQERCGAARCGRPPGTGWIMRRFETAPWFGSIARFREPKKSDRLFPVRTGPCGLAATKWVSCAWILNPDVSRRSARRRVFPTAFNT